MTGMVRGSIRNVYPMAINTGREQTLSGFPVEIGTGYDSIQNVQLEAIGTVPGYIRRG